MVQSSQSLTDFLKERTIFKVLDERVLSAICQLFEEERLSSGQVVFHEGDKADALYVIQQGRVSVYQGHDPPKLVTHLGSGDLFGEMAAYNESKRTATIRATEDSIVLRLPMKQFNELQAYFPQVTKEIVSLITKRLDKSSPTEAAGLKGDLSLFDLPTVIQTVISSRQTGILTLKARVGKLSAAISVRQGRLLQVGFGHLSGESAWYELLTHTEPMEFVFEPQPEENLSAADPHLSNKEPHQLLLEAARRSDELPQLMKKLDWPDMIYLQNGSPNWKGFNDNQAEIARKIWFLLEVGLSVSQIANKLPFDRWSVLSCMDAMREKEIIRAKAAPTPPTPEPATPVQQPVSLKAITIVNGINSVTASLSALLGRDQVRRYVHQAHSDASAKYPALSCLTLNPDRPIFDLNSEGLPDESLDSFLKGTEQLFYIFLSLIAKNHKPQV